MAFKKLLASLGAGGADVETVLADVNVVPGGVVRGQVHIKGGSIDQQVEALSVGLQATVEVESGDSEFRQNIEFTKVQLGGALALAARAEHTVPFSMPIPYETPITAIGGQPIRGMNIGVRTELEIAKAVDSNDLDPVVVHPLPAQQAILDAFFGLGFRFKHADMERGQIRGTRQRLPFYQEMEFYAPSRYKGVNEIELTFVADENAMDVILEMDKKPGLFTEGSDSFRSFQVGLRDYQATDWAGYINQWLSAVGSKRNWF
jgi:sporulation-control protein